MTNRRIPPWLLPAILAASLTGCGGSNDKAAVEREVARRVAAERQALERHEGWLRTGRVLGFIALSGGSVWGLARLQRAARPAGTVAAPVPPPPRWFDHFRRPDGRVIDLKPPRRPPPPNRPRRHRRWRKPPQPDP